MKERPSVTIFSNGHQETQSVVQNVGTSVDLSAYTLHAGDDSLPLTDCLRELRPDDSISLAAGERIILGFGANLQDFMRTTAIPSAYGRNVVLQTTFKLKDPALRMRFAGQARRHRIRGASERRGYR